MVPPCGPLGGNGYRWTTRMAPIAAGGSEDSAQADRTRAVHDAGDVAPRGLAAGSEEAFMRVYDAHADEIFAFFVYRVGNRDDAEDLTQILFERAIDSWHRYDPLRVKPITWLVAIARNMLIDRHRRRQTRPESLVAETEALEGSMPPV